MRALRQRGAHPFAKVNEAGHDCALLNRVPPLQDTKSYNLVQVLEQVKKLGTKNPSR